MPITLTKADLIDELAEVMSDTCDMDVVFSDYAKAVVERLEKLGAVFEDAPLPARVNIEDKGGIWLPVWWSVEFDSEIYRSRNGRVQTVAKALIAVQLAIDEMRDRK